MKTARDYLTSLHWDGVPRIDTWLTTYAGAENSATTRRLGRRALIAAVRRALHPGCRVDQMLVIEGPQGCGKTAALRVLAVDEAWFSDAFSPSERGLVEKTLGGKWIVEAAELQSLGRDDVGVLKACLSKSIDEARMPYSREVTRAPRSFLIVGTTSAAPLLTDDALRRFGFVLVKSFDLKKLRADRDQLWAETVAAEAAGEPHFFFEATS